MNKLLKTVLLAAALLPAAARGQTGLFPASYWFGTNMMKQTSAAAVRAVLGVPDTNAANILATNAAQGVLAAGGGQATNAVTRIQTNSATLGSGITNLNFVGAGNTTVTGAVVGGSATIGVSSTASGGTVQTNIAAAAVTNAGTLIYSNSVTVANILDANTQTNQWRNDATNAFVTKASQSNSYNGTFAGKIASGAATNAAGSRVAYLTDITGGSATNAIGNTNGFGYGVTEVQQLVATQVVANTFIGSAVALTNFPISTNYVFDVSSRGIANGLSTNWNDGKAFGPDTPGTVSSGVQEAYDFAVTNRTTIGPEAIGVRLRLAGYYYYTNQLVFSNNWMADLTLDGYSAVATKLVYAGSNGGIATVVIRGGTRMPSGESLIMPINLTIHDIGFAAINDTTNILLLATNYSHADIQRCNFTSWIAMTNQDWGSGMSIVRTSEIYPSSLVGAVLGNGGENGTFLDNCNFGVLGTGVQFNGDHLYSRGCTFSDIGNVGGAHITAWPTESLYSLGTCYLFASSLNYRLEDVYIYTCTAGITVFNPLGSVTPVQVEGMWTEDVGSAFAAVSTNSVHFYKQGVDGGEFPESRLVAAQVRAATAFVDPANVGSGYTNGQVLTVIGGTQDPAAATNALLLVTSVTNSGMIATVVVTNGGNYIFPPGNPADVAGLLGAKFNLTWTNFTGFYYSNNATLAVRRYMYENNRDNAADAWDLVFAKKYEAGGSGAAGFFGRMEGGSNYSASLLSGAATVFRPVPAIVQSTNQFYLFGSGSIGMDGYWSWNGSALAYTNPAVSDGAAVSEAVMTPAFTVSSNFVINPGGGFTNGELVYLAGGEVGGIGLPSIVKTNPTFQVTGVDGSGAVTGITLVHGGCLLDIVNGTFDLTNYVGSNLASYVAFTNIPGIERITITNSAHHDLANFDYVLTTWRWRMTNVAQGMWADQDDSIPGIWGWWSGSTNQTAVFSGLQTKLQVLGTHLSTGSGGIDNAADNTVVYAERTGVSVLLPDARTNQGRFVFVKNLEGSSNTLILPVGGITGQPIDNRPAFVLTNSLASVALHCWSGRWWTLSLDEGVGVGGGGTADVSSKADKTNTVLTATTGAKTIRTETAGGTYYDWNFTNGMRLYTFDGNDYVPLLIFGSPTLQVVGDFQSWFVTSSNVYGMSAANGLILSDVNPDIGATTTSYLGILSSNVFARNATFTGHGGGLSNLNASALSSGTIPYTRAGSLSNHNDVTVTSLTAGDHLAWSGTAWTNGTHSGSSGSSWVRETIIGGALGFGTIPQSTQRYLAMVGNGNNSAQSTTTPIAMPAPSGGYLSNLIVYTSVSWPATTNCIFTIYTNLNATAGAATPITCTLVPSSSGVTTNSGTTSVALNSGTGFMWEMGIFANNVIASQNLSWSVEWWHQ